MKNKEYESIHIYFDMNNEEQKNLYEKLRELAYLKKIKSMSSFLKSCAYTHLLKKKLIK